MIKQDYAVQKDHNWRMHPITAFMELLLVALVVFGVMVLARMIV